jgi:predicted transcriptional regulator
VTRVLEGIQLNHARVRAGTPFREATRVLRDSGASMVAVVDEADRVVGLFGDEHVLEGMLPGYLRELRHTAFAQEDAAVLAARASEVGGEPVDRHCAKPVAVDRSSSGLHVGEVFLHSRLPAIAVVTDGVFVGVLERSSFARALLDRLESERSG